MKQNFIFDLDGTLVDSLPGIAAAVNVALPHSLNGVTDLKSRIGPSIRSILRGLADLPGHAIPQTSLDRIEGAFRRYYDSRGWRETVAFPGAAELLQQLQEEDKRIFLVTNKPWTPVFGILGMLGWRSYFDQILTPDSSDPVFQDKTEMLGFLVSRRNLTIDTCLMIGDTADDCAAAGALGMDAVFVSHGYGIARLSDQFPRSEIVPDLAAIADRYVEMESEELAAV